MTVAVVGSQQLLAKFAKHKAHVRDCARAAVYQRALQIMAASDSLIPVDTGRARSSHFVSEPTQAGEVTGGYGGLDYIIPLHENLAAHHEHGQAKFLEHAFMEYLPGSPAWIAAKTVENIGTNTKFKGSGAYPTSPSPGGGK